MIKAQKSTMDIIKIVHVTSVVQPYFFEAMRILFVCKENKNNDFIQQFLLFHVSLWRAFMKVPRRTRVHSSACKQGAAHLVSTSERRLLLTFLGHKTFQLRCWLWRVCVSPRNFVFAHKTFVFFCKYKIGDRINMRWEEKMKANSFLRECYTFVRERNDFQGSTKLLLFFHHCLIGSLELTFFYQYFWLLNELYI